MKSKEIEYRLEERKDVDKKEINDTETPSLAGINQHKKLLNINQELNLSSSKDNRSNNLSYSTSEIIYNEKLSNFQINKILTGRESYFYFLKYIFNVKIIDKTEKKEIKKEEKSKMEKKEEPNLFIDCSGGKINIKDNNKYKTVLKKNRILKSNYNSKEQENLDEFYKKIIYKKNINIQKYFVMQEEITLKELEGKMYQYYKDFLHLFLYNNIFPEFQSELFFYYQLKNIFKTFFELDKENFYKKIKMINYLKSFILDIEKKDIKDTLVLNYFYFIMDLEYEIKELNDISLINDYSEANKSYKNAHIKDNKLIIENSEIVVDNIDCYNLNDNIIKKLKEGIFELSLLKGYLSLKGKLSFRELSTKDGNIIYDAFLPSKLNKDIIFKLYDIEDSIFSSEEVIQLFKANTYYFPINNKKYLAYTNKECFKIFIDYKVGENIFYYYSFNEKIIHIIRKSIMIINIQHEFGHSHKLVLFSFDNENDYFCSPLVKLKISDENEIEIDEGGELFEYLLYGRSIEEINMKEVIYINNFNNFSKTLEEFRNDFNDLKNKKLKEVLIKEAGSNKEINEVIEIYENLSEEEKYVLENISFKTGKKYKNVIPNELENLKFKIIKRKPHNKNKDKYVISKFSCGSFFSED